MGSPGVWGGSIRRTQRWADRVDPGAMGHIDGGFANRAPAGGELHPDSPNRPLEMDRLRRHRGGNTGDCRTPEGVDGEPRASDQPGDPDTGESSGDFLADVRYVWGGIDDIGSHQLLALPPAHR